MTQPDARLRDAVAIVAFANFTYFGVEFTVAQLIGSVSLLADSADFFEDAAVNLLISASLGWSLKHRARVGMFLSFVLLLPALAFLWTLWHKLSAPVVPSPLVLGLTGGGALVINLGCAFLLARYRHHAGSLTRAAFLSARNDVLANIGIIAASGITALTLSIWPDIIVGFVIAWLNLDAAKQVWTAARSEHLSAEA
ncbi:cation transporter [Novosphingobium rosa]|jgi:Co/Zn/Cd efflux system component|uniref:cation transporter n=1 Tax=Novosphingobium rosa TaxID=76978 RepID=UPI00082EC3A4|nr:cation transporter [Novosphingobium rosa]